MKAQMNIEFILGVSVMVVTISFIGFSIINHFPVIHTDSVYETEKSKSFQISHLLVYDEGIWTDSKIANCNRIGLTEGKPFILNVSKIMALNNCNQVDYFRIKSLLGTGSGSDVLINITKLNFTGGPDLKISECRPMLISLSAAKFWAKRYAVMDNGTMDIVRVDTAVYGYI